MSYTQIPRTSQFSRDFDRYSYGNLKNSMNDMFGSFKADIKRNIAKRNLSSNFGTVPYSRCNSERRNEFLESRLESENFVSPFENKEANPDYSGLVSFGSNETRPEFENFVSSLDRNGRVDFDYPSRSFEPNENFQPSLSSRSPQFSRPSRSGQFGQSGQSSSGNFYLSPRVVRQGLERISSTGDYSIPRTNFFTTSFARNVSGLSARERQFASL